MQINHFESDSEERPKGASRRTHGVDAIPVRRQSKNSGPDHDFAGVAVGFDMGLRRG